MATSRKRSKPAFSTRFRAVQCSEKPTTRAAPLAPAIRLDVPEDLSDALGRVRAHLAAGDDVVGPLPLERGRRALLIRSQDRTATLGALRPLRDILSRQGVDLRVDVDPVDLG
jgi:hypothetical protein